MYTAQQAHKKGYGYRIVEPSIFSEEVSPHVLAWLPSDNQPHQPQQFSLKKRQKQKETAGQPNV